jgi:hypothetical protein
MKKIIAAGGIAIGLLTVGLFTVFMGDGNITKDKTGTVQYINLEGGFYGIIDEDGNKYDPVNLPDEFKQDGLRVKFSAKILKDQMSIHMWGTLIEITEIEEI